MLHNFYPLISIVIPVYNGSNYIESAIQSALNQSYKNIEIIVVNDGSQDNGKTDHICANFKNNIRYYKKENGGVASALNFGVSQAKGNYISWLSHDDCFHPQKIEKQINYISLSELKEALIFSSYYIIDASGSISHEQTVNNRWLKHSILTVLSTSINGCTTLVPKKIFSDVGLFNEQLITVQDNDLWLRMATKGVPFFYLPIPLLYSRQHEDQTSKILKDHHYLEKEKFYISAIRSMPEFSIKHHEDILHILKHKGLTISEELLRSIVNLTT